MDTIMDTLAHRIEQDHITVRVTYGTKADAPSDMANMDPWTVTLEFAGHKMAVPFYMGRGHHGKPPACEDVLDCLLADAAGYEQARDFEDWASEYGYDPDSRNAEAVWRAVAEQTRRLRLFLGLRFEAYVYETERL